METTIDTIRCDYIDENKSHLPPKIGLALSGGGTRAGYFSLGVLSGLSDAGILDKIDIISSVSGGGYAAYWYFARRMESRRLGYDRPNYFGDCAPSWWVEPTTSNNDNSDILLKRTLSKLPDNQKCFGSNTAHFKKGDPYRWQSWLAQWPDLFNVIPIQVTGNAQKKLSSPYTSSVIFSSLKGYMFRNLLKDSNNESLSFRYESAIDRVWGLEPLPRKNSDDKPMGWTFANANNNSALGNSKFNTNPYLMNWPNWRYWRDSTPNAPMWILNGRINNKLNDNHPENIYEITAYGNGSQKTGYVRGYFSDGTLRRSVRASGAFADYQGVAYASTGYALARLANILTGQLSWGVDIHSPDTGKIITVSDGGSEDNTGVYSLIRRGVNEIILVDASYDLSGTMEDLCNITKTLNAHIPISTKGFSLKIKSLPNLEHLCQENDNGRNRIAYNTSEWINPILKGEILWPKNPQTKKYIMPPVKIWYIKLSWNQKQARWAFNKNKCEEKESNYFSCVVTAYYGSNTLTTKMGDGYMLFPQLGTVGITYNASTYLFWAYRELGRSIGRRFIMTQKREGKSLNVQDLTQCSQPQLTARSGLRPVNYDINNKNWIPCRPVMDTKSMKSD